MLNAFELEKLKSGIVEEVKESMKEVKTDPKVEREQELKGFRKNTEEIARKSRIIK